MNKYKINRGRVAFVTLSFGIIAMLMIMSANNRAPELSYESPYEESSEEVVLDDRAEAYIAEAIEAIDVIIEEAENAEAELETVASEPESFNEAFAQARALLGTDHAFTWNGQEYTTSYAEELAAKSSPVKDKEDSLDSDEDSNDTKFTADEDEDVYSAVLGSNVWHTQNPMKRVWPPVRPVFWLTKHLNTTYKNFMKYIFSLFLVIIFLTEHYSPLTRTTDVLIKVVDNGEVICYSACDIDPLITEPEPQTDLWQHLKENLSWNTYYKDKTVQQEIERIKNHGSWYFNYLSHQASPYIHYVTTELEKRGLPLELALLPFIESNYDPYAFSHGSAAGFWQMIPSTLFFQPRPPLIT